MGVMRMRLRDASPTSCSAASACVASACASITGLPPELWVQEFRKHHAKACTAKRGTSVREYGPALDRHGFTIARVKPWWNDVKQEHSVPLHRALAMLHRLYPNEPLLLVVDERRTTHMVAALGYIVADNTSIAPMWWADWADLWRTTRVYTRRLWDVSRPREPRVSIAYVVRKNS